MAAEQFKTGSGGPPDRALQAEETARIDPPAAIGHLYLIALASGDVAMAAGEVDPERAILIGDLHLVAAHLRFAEDQAALIGQGGGFGEFRLRPSIGFGRGGRLV